MPASNPIVNGVHVSSYATTQASPPAASGSPAQSPKTHSTPFAVILFVALLVLLFLRLGDFNFVVSGGAR